MFDTIIDSTGITFQSALICTLVSLVLGLLISVVYMTDKRYTRSYIISLVMLPAIVQIVIMMVNGNVGTGVAVMGAFSLIRFRSAQGSAKEILFIFLAMSVGIATGMGYVVFAAVVTVILLAVYFALVKLGYGNKTLPYKHLKITIPEDLDYTNVFDDIFDKYVRSVKLEKVKTTNLGSMYELHYEIELKNEAEEKNLIDELRTRNGNLSIICATAAPVKEEL